MKSGFSYEDAVDFCIGYEMTLYDPSTSSDAKSLMLKWSRANFGISDEYNLWVLGKTGEFCSTAENTGSLGSWIVNPNQDCSEEFWFYCEYNKFMS